MSNCLRIHVLEEPINSLLEECKNKNDSRTLLRHLEHQLQQSQKDHAFFDEKVFVCVIADFGVSADDHVSIDIQYTSEKYQTQDQPAKRVGQKVCTILGNPDYNINGISVWKYEFSVTPGRNYDIVTLTAKYIENTDKAVRKFNEFHEVNLVQIEDAEFYTGPTTDLHAQLDEQENHSLISSHSLRIYSLYKMSLKSFRTEKTIAWLDLSASKAVKESQTSILINSIDIDSSSCEVESCTQIEFPLRLTSELLLTAAYHVLYDDESSVKPLIVTIDALVDGRKHIITQWSSNIDLSNNNLPLTNSNSSGNLQGKKIHSPKLLPPAKLSKLRSYNHLVNSQNTLKVSPSRQSPNMSISTGTTGMGGKRYSSMTLKSGSNLSLSQLWNGNTTQSFQRGLVIAVSGPTRVKLGEKFSWKIQLLNKSQAGMDLILYVQSSIKKEYEKTIPPIPIQSGNKMDTVPLFSNGQLIRNFYQKFNTAGLVSLTNNLRVTLQHGNLYECELELMSVERGMFNIYDFKVLDIASGDIFECNRLLDVMVV